MGRPTDGFRRKLAARLVRDAVRLLIGISLISAGYLLTRRPAWTLPEGIFAAVIGLALALAATNLPRQITLLLGLEDTEESDSFDAIAHERGRLTDSVRALRKEVAEKTHEAERLDRIIQSYRDQASSEFRQAATDLLGEESAATVAAHYDRWATDLNKRYRRARNLAVLVLIVGSAIVTSLLFYGTAKELNPQLITAKITVGIPVGVLCILLYRESAQYRRESLLAANISVQMRSVAAYTLWLDAESKNTVRRRLGEALFVGPPAHLLDMPASPNGIPTELLLQLIRSSLGVDDSKKK